MKAGEIINFLESYSFEHDFSDTCDTFKSGSADVEVTKVAVAMFGTPDVIRQAKAFGAELLIVHEPLYYNHFDSRTDDPIEAAKAKLLEDSGITVYRYHDHPHYSMPDLIAVGELNLLGLKGEIKPSETFDLARVYLNEPMTARQLAKHIEEKLNIKNVRIAGSTDKPITTVSCMFGAPGGLMEELKRDVCEALIAGEVCEWALCEYARDASQLGYTKAVLTLGHVGSERAGMVYISDLLKARFADVEVQYFECGEVYTYTE